MSLKDLPYGTVIEYRKKRWFKFRGMDGGALMAENDFGNWHFIKGEYEGKCNTVNWKMFHVLYSPREISEA